MNLKDLVNKIFYSESSEEGKNKKIILEGKHPISGRLATVNMLEFSDRKYPYRVTAADLSYLSKNRKNILSFNHAAPNQDAFANYLNSDNDTFLDLLMEIMPTITTQAIKAVIGTNTPKFSKLITGCQFEIFICLSPQPLFMIEIFPEIKGIPLDDYYGSRAQLIFPLSYFSENMKKTGEGKNLARFASIVFYEKISEVEGGVYAFDFLRGELFDIVKEKKVITEWFKEQYLWFINEPKYVFIYLVNFAVEFLIYHKVISGVDVLIDSPDSIIGKPVFIEKSGF